MTFMEVQAACRAVIYGAGLGTFTLTVQAVEHHPNRVDIRWTVFVPREAPNEGLYRSAFDPADLIAWLKVRLENAPESQPPPSVSGIGEVPIADGG